MIETVVPTSVRQWLTQGETLYAAAMEEYRALEARLAELEGRLRDKLAEVNQVARVLGKPVVDSARGAIGAAAPQPVVQPSSSKNDKQIPLDEALRIRGAALAAPVRPPALPPQKVEIRRRPVEPRYAAV